MNPVTGAAAEGQAELYWNVRQPAGQPGPI